MTALDGSNGHLESISWRRNGGVEKHAIGHLFLFIGADPNTDWLRGSGIHLDDRGFVRTGDDLQGRRNALETSQHGIFAIGDVRSGSIKRVAASVGEGAQAVAALHAYLAERAVV